jgi:hypothetical protein
VISRAKVQLKIPMPFSLFSIEGQTFGLFPATMDLLSHKLLKCWHDLHVMKTRYFSPTFPSYLVFIKSKNTVSKNEWILVDN